jgi:peptide/nickel transport system substrate-binding protein
MKKLLLALALMSLLALAGCGGASATQPPSGDSGTPAAAAPGDITVVVREVGNNMDTLVANYTDTSIIMYHVYDQLVTIDDNLAIQEGVASSWNQPDNTTIEFVIKDGYKFHNGDPMTIDDVVFSIERTRDIARMASFVENLKEVSASGNTVTVKMNEPDSGYIRTFSSIVILSKKYCEEVGDAYANAPIGTGPFKVKEYIPGSRMVLEAWADYPFEKAKLNTITFKGISEQAAKYIAIESGDAHFALIDAKDKSRAESNDKVNLFEKTTTYTGFVAMNSTLAPFDNVNVRRAIASAYNKEGIAGISPGQKTIDSMFPTMFETYSSSEFTPTYDLAKAKELLEAEGYNAGNPLKFEAWIYSDSGLPPMEAFQAELRSIGVEMTIVNLEFGVFLEKMANGEYQLLSGGWNNVEGNPLSSFECYYSGSFGNMNIGFYSNPRADELYALAKATTSREDLLAYAKEIQDIAAKDVPILPSSTQLFYYAAVKGLQGVDMLTNAYVSFRGASFS